MIDKKYRAVYAFQELLFLIISFPLRQGRQFLSPKGKKILGTLKEDELNLLQYIHRHCTRKKHTHENGIALEYNILFLDQSG